MFATRPVDATDGNGKWLASYRYEPFLKKWFLVDPDEAARVVLLESEYVPETVRNLCRSQQKKHPLGAYAAPIKMQIQLCTHCNYKCRMCYASSERRRTQQVDLTCDELDQLFGFLKDWGILRVNFVGGEVFLRRDFREIVTSAQRHRLLVSCITNARIPGAAIDSYRDLLLSLWNTQVSCNGIGENYEKEYQTRSWQRARKCIENVINATRRNILSYVVTPQNFHQIPQFMRFANDIRPSVVKFGSICWSGRSSDTGSLDYYQYVLPAAQRLIWKSREAYPNLEVQSQIDDRSAAPQPQDRINSYRPLEFYFSPEGRDGLYIQANGDVFPFPLLSDREEFRLGNIRQHSLREIWNDHEVLYRIRSVTFAGSDCARLGCECICGLWNRSYAIAWSGRVDGKVPCAFTDWQF